MNVERERFWMNDTARGAAREVIDKQKEIAVLLDEVIANEKVVTDLRQALSEATTEAARQYFLRQSREEAAAREALSDDEILKDYRRYLEIVIRLAEREGDDTKAARLRGELNAASPHAARKLYSSHYQQGSFARESDEFVLNLYRDLMKIEINSADSAIRSNRRHIAALEKEVAVRRTTIESERLWFVRSGVSALLVATLLSIIGNALWYGHGYLHMAVIPSPIRTGSTILIVAMAMWTCILIVGALQHIGSRRNETFRARQKLTCKPPAAETWFEREGKKPWREQAGAFRILQLAAVALAIHLLLAPFLFFSSLPVVLLQHHQVVPAGRLSLTIGVCALLAVWGIISGLLWLLDESASKNNATHEELSEIISVAIGAPFLFLCFVGLLCAYFVPSPFDKASEAITLIVPEKVRAVWAWTALSGLGLGLLLFLYELWESLIGRNSAIANGADSLRWRSGPDIVSWREQVPLESVGRSRDRFERNMMLLSIFGGPAIGWLVNGGAGASIGVLIGFVVAGAFNRYAVPRRVESGTLLPFPTGWDRRGPTEAEQRIDARVVSMPGEAQAFIDWQGGDRLAKDSVPWFVVQARRKGRIVERLRIPWEQLRSIERELSFKRQFIGSGDGDDMPDASCIFVRHVDHTGHHRADWIAIDAGGLANLEMVHLDVAARFGIDARAAVLPGRDRPIQEQDGAPEPSDQNGPAPAPAERTRPVL